MWCERRDSRNNSVEYLLKWWKGKAELPSYCLGAWSPPEREHREIEVAFCSLIGRDGLGMGESQIFLSHFPGKLEKFLFDLPTEKPYLSINRCITSNMLELESLQYILKVHLAASIDSVYRCRKGCSS